MAYGFFLGCIMPLRYPGIESATRNVMKELGVEFVELEGASCCPAPGVTRSFDIPTWLALAARNLAVAEKKKVDIITVCNGCFGSLFEAAHELNEDEEKRKKVNAVLKEIGMEYNGTVKVYHFAEVLHREVGTAKITAKVKKPMKDCKVAVHYGCHFLSPSKLKKIDDPERPKILDELVEAVGATSVPYADKRMCCGAGGGVRARSPDVALKMTKGKLENIKKVGANCIIDVCPFCHLQYDTGQKELGGGYDLPVLHLSQLYALAFGTEDSRLGFEGHATPVNLK